MNYDVFLSYSRKDIKKADEIVEALSAAGLRCFIDRDGIDGGANFPKVLANAIDDSGVFLLLAGKNSYASRFTQAEILHAFKHKRSGSIIPYLIDDSPMPADLEFLLGNVNWVDSTVHPVKELPGIVRNALANPNSGTVGGRKVRGKWYRWLLIPLLAAVVVGVAVLVKNDMAEKNAESVAMAHQADYHACLNRADSLSAAAAVLGRSENAIESTREQILCLKQASAELQRADSIKALHTADGFYALFIDDGTIAAEIKSAMDSIHTAWSDYARESYKLWCITRSAYEAENALECIDYALSIMPSPELEAIKLELTK